MAEEILTIKMNPELKKAAEEVFKNEGMTFEEAVTRFLNP